MTSPEAALCFTAEKGWYLEPSPAVLRIVKDHQRAYPRPTPRTDRYLTARLMEEAGYSEAQIEKTLARRPAGKKET